MSYQLIAVAALVVAANAVVLPSALDKANNADRARIALIKVDDYEQSEQAKTARYANTKLKEMRSHENEK